MNVGLVMNHSRDRPRESIHCKSLGKCAKKIISVDFSESVSTLVLFHNHYGGSYPLKWKVWFFFARFIFFFVVTNVLDRLKSLMPYICEVEDVKIFLQNHVLFLLLLIPLIIRTAYSRRHNCNMWKIYQRILKAYICVTFWANSVKFQLWLSRIRTKVQQPHIFKR